MSNVFRDRIIANITINGETFKNDNPRQQQLEVVATIPHFGSFIITIGTLLIVLGCLGILLLVL